MILHLMFGQVTGFADPKASVRCQTYPTASAVLPSSWTSKSWGTEVCGAQVSFVDISNPGANMPGDQPLWKLKPVFPEEWVATFIRLLFPIRKAM